MARLKILCRVDELTCMEETLGTAKIQLSKQGMCSTWSLHHFTYHQPQRLAESDLEEHPVNFQNAIDGVRHACLLYNAGFHGESTQSTCHVRGLS